MELCWRRLHDQRSQRVGADSKPAAVAGEVSAEMALELRTSLATIAEYAKRLERDQIRNDSPGGADIASEASRSTNALVDFWRQSMLL